MLQQRVAKNFFTYWFYALCRSFQTTRKKEALINETEMHFMYVKFT